MPRVKTYKANSQFVRDNYPEVYKVFGQLSARERYRAAFLEGKRRQIEYKKRLANRQN